VAIGLPMEAVNDFFDQAAPEIFRANWFSKISSLWSTKYGSDVLEAELQNLFGTHTLGDCKTKFIAPAFDTASGRNVYFQSYGVSDAQPDEIIYAELDLELWKVCRASAAAQTYFPAFQLHDLNLIDGGNTGNAAPDSLVLAEAYEISSSELRMLSLGTGAARWTGGALGNAGLLHAGVATIDILFSGANANSVWQAASVLGNNHLRLDPQLTKNYELDDASSETLNDLEVAAENIVADHREALKGFLQ
jgi:uncharacterized protein